MRYHTIEELKSKISEQRKIVSVTIENKWVVVTLETGLRIKFLNWK